MNQPANPPSEIRLRAAALVRKAKLSKLGPGLLFDEWAALCDEVLNQRMPSDPAELDVLAARVIDLMERIIATEEGK